MKDIRPINYVDHDFVGDRNNARCKLCQHPMCFHRQADIYIPANVPPDTAPIRSSWRTPIQCGELTGKKIEDYKTRGFYSEEYRLARRERMNQKKPMTTGNFIEVDGRLIYRLPSY